MDESVLIEEPTPAVENLTEEPIAPWWHTAVVLLLMGTWAAISARRTASYEGAPHPLAYLSQLTMSWMLFGSVVAGVINRRQFFFETLQRHARSFAGELRRGATLYVGIYFVAIVVAATAAGAMSVYRAHSSGTRNPATATHPADTTWPPLPPAKPEPLAPTRASHFKLDSKTVRAIAPSTPLDMLLWLLVSCTAGFCEEHIFRGYLLKQAMAYVGLAGAPHLLATVLSVAITSLIFGSLHLYEGVGGAALITVLGAIYAVVALRFGNLRAVIVAHFLQDFVTGLFLFFTHAQALH